MSTNPLFPDVDDPSGQQRANVYVLQKQKRTIAPLQDSDKQQSSAQATDLIRNKIARIFAEEPDALLEEEQSTANPPLRSKHQQFMQNLTVSGKGLAEIQTAWHAYYTDLPDTEKHEVWQEFYASNSMHRDDAHIVRPDVHGGAAGITLQTPRPAHASQATPAKVVARTLTLPYTPEKRSVREIRKTITRKISAGGRLTIKHHLQSMLFGLGVGAVALVIFLFGFFNEVIIAPFIQPSRNVGATPIIIDPSTVTANTSPEVIIPKIHLEIPADYTQTSTNEATIENALENGIVHYPSTVMPGQQGNAAFFGHSSNNIFNPGKYKFAFVLLHELVAGDTFYLTYNGKVYIYKVFEKMIVNPSDVNVLNNIAGHTATATLITCDPPGTSLNRLIVVGDQISPDPSTNTNGVNTTASATSSSTQLPGNGPTLFSRLWHTLF